MQHLYYIIKFTLFSNKNVCNNSTASPNSELHLMYYHSNKEDQDFIHLIMHKFSSFARTYVYEMCDKFLSLIYFVVQCERITFPVGTLKYDLALFPHKDNINTNHVRISLWTRNRKNIISKSYCRVKNLKMFLLLQIKCNISYLYYLIYFIKQ